MGTGREKQLVLTGTCCSNMMVEVSRVSIPCFLVTTIIMGLNVMKGSTQKISDRILDDILGDIANQYQSADYGAMDYNDLVPEDASDLYRDAVDEPPRSLKPNHNGKDSMKNAMLPAYCDPPNPCPIGYTEEDGCIEILKIKQNSAESIRPRRTVCVIPSTCLVAPTLLSPTSTRSSRLQTSSLSLDFRASRMFKIHSYPAPNSQLPLKRE